MSNIIHLDFEKEHVKQDLVRVKRKPKKGKGRKLEWEKGVQKRVEKMHKDSGRSKILKKLEKLTRSELLEILDYIWENCKSKIPQAMPQPFLYYMLLSDNTKKRRDYRNVIESSKLRAFIADLWVFCQQDFKFDPKEYFKHLYTGRQNGRAYGPSHRTH